MDEKTRDGYVASIICLFVTILFAYVAIMSISNMTTAVIMGVFAVFFGGLGCVSFAKPDTVGVAVLHFLRILFKSGEEGEKGSNSHNKQIQRGTSRSVQVMTGDQAEVHINVPSGEKKQAEKPSAEEKETLRKETIVVTSDGYFYEFDLMKGDHLKGEITSTSPIDVLFVDKFGFDKWSKGRKYFEPEDSNDSVLETNIDYVAPKKGKWYVIIENNGRKSATVKVQLY